VDFGLLNEVVIRSTSDTGLPPLKRVIPYILIEFLLFADLLLIISRIYPSRSGRAGSMLLI
jgi:hypothetical protein